MSISSVISRPYAFPVGPTRRAESRTSIPPPEPRSSTVSPAFNCASAVGLPQPNEASTRFLRQRAGLRTIVKVRGYGVAAVGPSRWTATRPTTATDTQRLLPIFFFDCFFDFHMVPFLQLGSLSLRGMPFSGKLSRLPSVQPPCYGCSIRRTGNPAIPAMPPRWPNTREKCLRGAR